MITRKHSNKVLFTLLGAAISSFGIYNVHAQSNLAEGGSVGLALLAYQ
ncbi:hypothetical protein SDC9_167115 [bioreactor metagenome]|uniref:Uncharacterized protein n=1 Tax=bioreactor metagenome TaxID=1076179 RepID=A0A645G727_9ZZZZ